MSGDSLPPAGEDVPGTTSLSVTPDAQAAPETRAAQRTTGLSAAERSAAFAGSTPVDRSAALRAGRTPVPRRLVAWIAVAFVVIGLGGVVVEHYFGNYGVPASASTTTTIGTAAPPTPAQPVAPQLGASLDSFIGLKQLGDSTAPGLQLSESSGATWDLGAQTGKVVVLTFYNAGCDDACPVIGAELRQAAALLGRAGSEVEFAVVNTDPHRTAVESAPPALTVPGLQGPAGARFLTGPLPQLNAAWIAYGVTVSIGGNPPREYHNDILYFIDPRGHLRASALPFANEGADGVYSLPDPDIARFAQGIAQTAASLTKP